VRNGVHIVPRDLFGIPIQIVAMIATRLLPPKANDVVFPYILDLALGDLAKHGIKRPQEGILQQIHTMAKIPVIDVGTARKISEGAISIAPDIAEIVGDGACFVDSVRKKTFDAIILATGYRPNYTNFLQTDAIDTAGARAHHAGLYFVGFRNRVTGLFREICRETTAAVDDIARQRALSSRMS
jgi:indole-3-pyruvate monooxygenase